MWFDVGATFPDALDIAMSGTDAHLLAHYFTATNPSGFTDAQRVAVSGYSGMKAFIDAANQSQRTDPVPDRADIEGYLSARWHTSNAVPEALRYDPVKNPSGARPTIFDVAKNVYGVNPSTGAALRTFDNVGVQYGLNALNSGAITLTGSTLNGPTSNGVRGAVGWSLAHAATTLATAPRMALMPVGPLG